MHPCAITSLRSRTNLERRRRARTRPRNPTATTTTPPALAGRKGWGCIFQFLLQWYHRGAMVLVWCCFGTRRELGCLRSI